MDQIVKNMWDNILTFGWPFSQIIDYFGKRKHEQGLNHLCPHEDEGFADFHIQPIIVNIQPILSNPTNQLTLHSQQK